MSAGVRVTGLRQTIRSMERLGVSVADLKQAFNNISQKAVSDARSLAPTQSGALSASIRASKAKNKATIRAGTAKVYYASYVEYGTTSQSAQEFVTGAVEQNESYAVMQLDRELKTLIRRYNLN